MGKVVVDITTSLDGFVAAPGVDLAHGLGVGGEPLHEWAMGDSTEADVAVLEDAFVGTGAVIMGRTLFDIVDGPHGWGDEAGYGGRRDQSSPPPFFVLTHRPPERMRLTGDFTFVTEGIAAAVEQARAAAGEKDVVVMGGASVCDQAVAAGLVDEIHVHLAPVLLGGGTRLFDRLGTGVTLLRIDKVVDSPRATHLFYRVDREAGRP